MNRPTTLSEFIGNKSAITLTKQFIQSFPDKKAILYVGPPGTGKTSFALLLSELTKKSYSHLNASLFRKKDIESFGESIRNESIYNDRNIFILDEIDKLTKPQHQQLSKYIVKSKHPIIMIANYENKISSTITKVATVIRFDYPTKDDIRTKLEQITDNQTVISNIVDKADTIRTALNMLESDMVYDTEYEAVSNWDALRMQVEDGIDMHLKMSNTEAILYLSDSGLNMSMLDYYDGLNRRGSRLAGKAIKSMIKCTRVKKLTSFPRTWKL